MHLWRPLSTSDPQHLTISLFLLTSNTVSGFRVINDLRNKIESISLLERNKKIKDTRELLTKEIGELSRSEGGTGYPKIKKILLIDFKRTDFKIA